MDPLSPARETLGEVLALYPQLGGLGQSLADIAAGAQTVPAGTVLFSDKDPCRGFPLLLAGEVRVFRPSPDGRSLELYRLSPGEMCLVSSASLFRTQPLAADAVATRPTRLVMVPPDVFRSWLEHPGFRDFVLGMFAERMADLTALVDAVAFQRLDRRLAAALLGHGPELAVTHQDLADVLGTVREMITRLLRRFEREGWIELSRERVRIRDSAALRRLAGAG
jgi:CRP/FNR family transcriptional regulator